jgi:hypothetical protein
LVAIRDEPTFRRQARHSPLRQRKCHAVHFRVLHSKKLI